VDKIHDSLGLAEVDTAVEEGGAGKFAGCGEAAAALAEVLENGLGNERIAVSSDLQDRLACVGGPLLIVGEDDLIDQSVCAISIMPEIRASG
jgi:hypothetical protein